MFSQLFILSLRGDILINRDFRGDSVKNAAEVFFSHISRGKEELGPIFHIDGIQYIYIKNNSMYFVLTTRHNVSPIMAIEFLNRVTQLIKDYCGILTEEAIRKNFVLIYEILDEILDFGYPQSTATEKLKPFVLHSPELVKQSKPLKSIISNTFQVGSTKTTPSITANKPVTESSGNDEIYIDLLESLTFLFAANGNLLQSDIEGYIKMRSFLKGNPELRMTLNEDLIVGTSPGYVRGGGVWLESCAWHEVVDLSQWESDRSVIFRPPEGEFILMQYRVDSTHTSIVPPFRVLPFIEVPDHSHLEVFIKVRADIPKMNFGNNVTIKCPIPKAALGATCEVFNPEEESAEFVSHEKIVNWCVKKFMGGTEHTLRVKISFNGNAASYKKEVGPVSLYFDIPMFLCSNLQIRYLRINETGKDSVPYRWIRSITQSNSYVARIPL